MMKFVAVAFLLLLPGRQDSFARQAEQRPAPLTTEDLMIEVGDSSRAVSYTNTLSGVWYTETNAAHRSPWQGWRIFGHEVMEDYRISLDDMHLERAEIVRTRVYPDRFVREYRSGITETVTLLDSLDAIVVQLDHVPAGRHVTVEPLFSDIHDAQALYARGQNGILVYGRNDHRNPTPDEPYPGWLAFTMVPSRAFNTPYVLPRQVGKNFSRAYLTSVSSAGGFGIVFVAGRTPPETYGLAVRVSDNYLEMLRLRKERIEQVLNRSYLRTGDKQLDCALNWAKLSLDALIMREGSEGIFAGLPWFDYYRARDTYLSLPGATLVTGGFADAREILRSFAARQDTDSKSSTYGRVPDQTTTLSPVAFTSADGTPRFTLALMDYLNYSGDSSFAAEMYPVVKRAVEGTIRYHTDSLGFLTHGDAETWMDATGPNGPWSRRGNRANDVQALWHGQLRAAIALAGLVDAQGREKPFVDRWSALAGKLTKNFQKYFVDPSTRLLFDHLGADGTPAPELRPNQIMALDLVQDPVVRTQVLQTVTRKLVYPYGIASLSQDDENFHPYHHAPLFYVPDAAYQNGVVWTWLAGPWVDRAAATGMGDLAFQVTSAMAHQLLNRGVVGTLSELLDAVPHDKQPEPGLSGAYAQAAGLAEFVRSFYQSYLGVTVGRMGAELKLAPRLPSAIRDADFTVRVGSTTVDVRYHREGDSLRVTLASQGAGKELAVQCTGLPHAAAAAGTQSGAEAGGIQLFSGTTTLAPGSRKVLLFLKEGLSEEDERGTRTIATHPVEAGFDRIPPAEAVLATPAVRPDLKALQGPGHPLLKIGEIKRMPSPAALVCDASDPAGDDHGDGAYTYPATASLKPGSLDLLHFSVTADERVVSFKLTFRDLSDPGRHPECGFQWTYAAIAIDKDGKPGSGETRVGMNAHYTLRNGFAYENVIYIGSGIRVQDARGTTVAEYAPEPGDEVNPLGNAESKTVEFSLPVSVIGKPQPGWRFAVLAGAQDDHGGSGIGDFRSVGAKASVWSGGGKKKPSDPNVYDTLLPSGTISVGKKHE